MTQMVINPKSSLIIQHVQHVFVPSPSSPESISTSHITNYLDMNVKFPSSSNHATIRKLLTVESHGLVIACVVLIWIPLTGEA